MLLTVSSCVSKKDKEEEPSIQKENDVSIEKNKTNTARVKMNTTFSQEVKQLIEENISFNDLKIQIEKLNTISISDFSDETESIKENCTEFLKTLPESFKHKSVYSRIDAIKNFSNAIAFEKKKGYSDTLKRYKYSVYLVESYNSLVLQLNDCNNKLPEKVKKSIQQTLEIKKDSIVGDPLF